MSQNEKKETLCRACGSPFVHIKGTNVMVCSNVNCDGKVKDQDGKVKHLGTYFLMDGVSKKERKHHQGGKI